MVSGRPCFGSVTALIGYKDALKWVKGRGLMPASRCATCKVRESCERLVRERIKASTPLSEAYDEWLRAEGPSKLGSPGVDRTHVGRLWKKVGLAAVDADFTSSNDHALIGYYEKLDCDALQRDRDRHLNMRKRDRSQQSFVKAAGSEGSPFSA